MAYKQFLKTWKLRLTCLIMIGLLCGNAAHAQISIFNQKSTQTKYMLQQIAALKVYTDYLKKGYSVVKDGTKLINDIKNGEFGLHKNYFGSLNTVSGAVRKHPKAAAIYNMLSDISIQRGKFSSLSPLLPEAQATDLSGVLRSVAAQSKLDLDEILMVMEDGSIEMTEDQRIERIGKIYERVQKSWAWQRELFNRTRSLISYLERSKRDIDQQRKLQ